MRQRAGARLQEATLSSIGFSSRPQAGREALQPHPNGSSQQAAYHFPVCVPLLPCCRHFLPCSAELNSLFGFGLFTRESLQKPSVAAGIFGQTCVWSVQNSSEFPVNSLFNRETHLHRGRTETRRSKRPFVGPKRSEKRAPNTVLPRKVAIFRGVTTDRHCGEGLRD